VNYTAAVRIICSCSFCLWLPTLSCVTLHPVYVAVKLSVDAEHGLGVDTVIERIQLASGSMVLCNALQACPVPGGTHKQPWYQPGQLKSQ
jgi:hypothetical protein